MCNPKFNSHMQNLVFGHFENLKTYPNDDFWPECVA